jgi:diguanylate cyclase (GGDEF)-like protein
MAYYDCLTGLPNRLFFTERLKELLSRSKRRSQKGAIFFLDLDNFKNINDTLGHAYGDELLKKVAEKLKISVREYDIVARLGGDEFVIILVDMDGIEDVVYVGERLLELFNQAFGVEKGDEVEAQRDPAIQKAIEILGS